MPIAERGRSQRERPVSGVEYRLVIDRNGVNGRQAGLAGANGSDAYAINRTRTDRFRPI